MRPTHARILIALTAVVAISVLGSALFARGPDPVVYGPFPLPSNPYGPPHEQRMLSEAERVTREIVRTDRLLSDADGRTARTGNSSSREDLRHGRERQVEAKAAAEQTFYARAMRLTLESRAYAKSALTKVGPAENDPQIVARAMDQTEDALHRAKDLIEEGAGAKQRRRYAVLRKDQEEARRLYANGALRGAYAQTRVVRDGVLELLRQCENLPVSEETARKALRRAERALAQTRREMGPRPSANARNLERNAVLQIGKARVSFGRSSYRDALLHAKLAERHLQRAVDLHRLATLQTG